MEQARLIELVATFKQNNRSHAYGISHYASGVQEAVFMVEAITRELARNGVPAEAVEKALKHALGPGHAGQTLSEESKTSLAQAGLIIPPHPR